MALMAGCKRERALERWWALLAHRKPESGQAQCPWRPEPAVRNSARVSVW